VNFLADEGVEREIVDTLRRLGHTVLYVAEMSPGVTDDAVLDQANTTSSILITSDKDFGELVFRQKRIHQGVLLTRLEGLSAETKATTIAAVVTDFADQLPDAFSVVSSGTVRIRRQRS
jgi:predicted nuclease of predicted toxin-antitoxin system